MNIVEFEVDNQILSRKTKSKIVNKSHNYLKLCFDFSAEWDNCTHKYLICKTGEGNYQFDVTMETVDEDVNEVVIVPFPLITERYLYLTLYGTFSDESRITTNELVLKFVHSGYTTDISSIDPEKGKDVIMRFEQELDQIKETLTTKVDNVIVENHYIKGFCNGNLLFCFSLDNTHEHSSNNITDFGERTAVEIKQAYRVLENNIRQYEESE